MAMTATTLRHVLKNHGQLAMDKDFCTKMIGFITDFATELSIRTMWSCEEESRTFVLMGDVLRAATKTLPREFAFFSHRCLFSMERRFKLLPDVFDGCKRILQSHARRRVVRKETIRLFSWMVSFMVMTAIVRVERQDGMLTKSDFHKLQNDFMFQALIKSLQ